MTIYFSYSLFLGIYFVLIKSYLNMFGMLHPKQYYNTEYEDKLNCSIMFSYMKYQLKSEFYSIYQQISLFFCKHIEYDISRLVFDQQ